MPISKSHNFVFIHIPKTAGTSIERCLLDNNLISVGSQWLQGKIDNNEFKQSKYSNQYWHHLNTCEVRQAIGKEQWSNYFKFTFVRNPWDRAVSFYYYIKQSIKNPNSLSFGKTYPDTFEDWVEKQNLPSDQQSQITDSNGKIMVDFVGKFENLENDFKVVSSKLELPELKLEHLKKTNRQNYQTYYEKDRTIQIIADKYKQDIDLFGYEFE
jgi:hypothetical protein